MIMIIIPCIKLMKIFKNLFIIDTIDNKMFKENHFYDELHLTPLGNSILANKIIKTYIKIIND